MYKLSQSTIEKLEYYIYLLSDPRTDKVFYVGKGHGNRINNHLLGALEGKTKETSKIKIIRDIQSSNKEVGLTILRHGLTEKEAFEIESSVIDLLGIDNLTNLVQGLHSYDRGIMSLSDLKIEYEAEDAVFDEPVMLININKLYRPKMSPKDIFEVTKGNWKVGSRAQDFKIVCAEYRGIIREVFKSQGWHKSKEEGRSYFEGSVAPDNIRNKYIHKSISKYRRKGSQNPIKYID